jgi:hypothetical protein
MPKVMRVTLPLVLCSLVVAVPSLWAYWVQNGNAICTATGEQEYPQTASDGAGGAIVTWEDARNGVNYDVYAQRVDSSGAVQWTADGVVLCAATGSQTFPTIAYDGAGEAIISWSDSRGGANYDIYAGQLDSKGRT